MPQVISQKDQLARLNDHSGLPHRRGQTYTSPPMAQTTKVPKTVRCE